MKTSEEKWADLKQLMEALIPPGKKLGNRLRLVDSGHGIAVDLQDISTTDLALEAADTVRYYLECHNSMPWKSIKDMFDKDLVGYVAARKAMKETKP